MGSTGLKSECRQGWFRCGPRGRSAPPPFPAAGRTRPHASIHGLFLPLQSRRCGIPNLPPILALLPAFQKDPCMIFLLKALNHICGV